MKTARIALALSLAILVSGTAYAKPDTVPGAVCTVCHKAMPPAKDNLNPKATAMLKTYKDVAKCKECHSKGEGGKMATKVPAK